MLEKYYVDVIWIKIDVPNLLNDHNWIIIYVWYVVKCGSKNKHQKDMCVRRKWTTFSKHDYHFRFNSQHNWESLIDKLISKRLFT